MSSHLSSRFRFTDILVNRLPDSFAKSAIGTHLHEVDLDKARQQHQAYIDAFKRAGANVTELPPAEEFPDCVFVEDTAVIVGDTALMTRPGAESRRGEPDRIRPVLRDFGFRVVDIEDEEATLDGGDVIYTGKEIIVSLSERTNANGVDQVRKAFPELNVIVILVSGPLHLTTRMHLCDEDTFCVSTETGDSLNMLKQIRAQSTVDYKSVSVPHDNAANCILLNGFLICKSHSEDPKSFLALQESTPHELIGLEMSEIEKAVGSISCMSLRFSRPQQQQQEGRNFALPRGD